MDCTGRIIVVVSILFALDTMDNLYYNFIHEGCLNQKDKEINIMLTKNLTVVNPSGLHLRPAGVLSQTAMKFKSDVIIESGEKRIVAKSVLNVMAAGIKCGTEITLICDGEDEAEAMKTISEAIESGLGEM